MRLIIVSSRFAGGGAEHVARENVEALLGASDIELSLITSKNTHYDVPHCILKDFRDAEGFVGQALASLFSLSNYYKAKAFLDAKKPDIIHFHDYLPYSPALIDAVYAYKRKSSCKVILTHHTYSFLCTNDGLYNYSQHKICEKCVARYDATILHDCCASSKMASIGKYIQKNLLKRKLHDMVDLHLSPSEFLKKKLVNSFDGLKVLVVRNPCISKEVDSYCGKRKREIVYFGRISREKNIVKFTKIFAEMNTDYRLLIIGTGPEEDALKELISNLQNSNIVFINRFLPTSELHNLIRKTAFFVLPSVWYENSPVSIVEAISLGIVPLVSNIGGMEELVKLFGVGETFNPNDGHSIRHLIESLDTLDTQIIQRDRTMVFTSDYYADAIKKIYEREV